MDPAPQSKAVMDELHDFTTSRPDVRQQKEKRMDFFVVEGGPQSTNDLMVMDESCAGQNGSRVSVLLLLGLLAARNGPFN